MLVIKEKAPITISYPIENKYPKERLLYFDIETTGFSRKYCHVYLIGCLYFIDEQPMYAQWLAENKNEEANILMAFHRFIQKYDTLVHFNGNSFDIPFLQERGSKYRLDFNFERFNSLDIYKAVSGLNHLLKTENQKQKSFEKHMGITRNDPFSGGDLIEVYKHYIESKDQRLLFPLLEHNREDIWNLGLLTTLLSFKDLSEHRFQIKESSIKDFVSMEGDTSQELCITLLADYALPFPVSYQNEDIYFKANNDMINISVKVKRGTYKFFFKDYKDYYYLTLEDRAMHKSVASFVDKQYRKPATAATCYEKLSGNFLPVFSSVPKSFTQIFKTDYKSSDYCIRLCDCNDETIFSYACEIIDFIFTPSGKK